jgi:hypothetical protein
VERLLAARAALLAEPIRLVLTHYRDLVRLPMSRGAGATMNGCSESDMVGQPLPGGRER